MLAVTARSATHGKGPHMRLDLQDRVELAHGIRWDGARRHLVDGVLDIEHPANDAAAVVLDAVADGGCLVGELVHRLAREFGIDTQVATTDVLALLVVLDDDALLDVSRPSRLRWRPDEVVAAVVGLVLGGGDFLARRDRATVGAVLRTTTRVLLLPLVVLVVGFVALVVALAQAGAHASSELLPEATGFVLAAVLTLWATTAAHEIGHLAVLSRAGVRSVLVLRGWRMALLHPRGSVASPRVVAVAGPLAGLAVGLASAALGLAAHLGPGFAVTAAAVGVSHLVHLSPRAADGAVLWRRSAPQEVHRAVA